MKRHLFLMSLCAVSLHFTSCSNDLDETLESNLPSAEIQEQIPQGKFAEPDNAKQISGADNLKLKRLLDAAGTEIINSLGSINITEDQYTEIKTFTDELVKGIESETEIYKVLFNWVTKNIKYEYGNNDPYPVFINRYGICQGYANLLTVMCHTQNVPAMVVNGILDPIGGHAWVYACPDDKWIVSDPTNGGDYDMANTTEYKHLLPSHADVVLFEDEVATYNYAYSRLNIKEVRSTDENFTVPYSAGGYIITSFNPTSDLPKTIKQLYIGNNIVTLGDAPIGLNTYGKYIEAAHVEETNKYLISHKGAVYKKNGGNPILYYVPLKMKCLELLPMETVGKNTIYNNPSIEEIVFSEGTNYIESYAVENCPKLVRVYVPENTEIAAGAFYKCSPRLEIIRGSVSGISHVKM